MDFGAQMPYACIRAYVMDERSIDQPATSEDIEQLVAVVREGFAAGALGRSMNRMPLHRAIDGSMVPGTNAGVDEVKAVGSVLGAARCRSAKPTASVVAPACEGRSKY
jgi:N-acyl-D-aspartate/D-glutamate deacylase